jgi:hypothetical protein
MNGPSAGAPAVRCSGSFDYAFAKGERFAQDDNK